MTVRVLVGHVLDRLRELPGASVQSCVTSPPYFGLRAYGTEPQVWGGDPEHDHEWRSRRYYREGGNSTGSALAFSAPGEANAQRLKEARWRDDTRCSCGAWRGELGSEPTPDLFVAHLVEVFREVRRVLRPDGVLLLNLGDSYVSNPAKGGSGTFNGRNGRGEGYDRRIRAVPNTPIPSGYKAKDLYGIPWMVAFALRADGWWLRGDYIWHKPSCMPESVRDRCTRSHEYVFHLTKSERYTWYQDAIREPAQDWGERDRSDAKHNGDGFRVTGQTPHRGLKNGNFAERGANRRSVWTISHGGFPDAHFATFPPSLAELMVKATTREGDTVLDPFAGAGTTLLAADRLGRNAIGVELNPSYAAIAEARITRDAPLFADLEVVA